MRCELCENDYEYRRGCTKKVCGSCMVNRHRFALKAACIKYKGGSCQLCGYARCQRALSFHHLEPTGKDFGVGGAHCRAWSKIKAELDKCVCLCKNCHDEVEDALEWRPQDPILIRLQTVIKAWKPVDVEFTRSNWQEYHPALVSRLTAAA